MLAHILPIRDTDAFFAAPLYLSKRKMIMKKTIYLVLITLIMVGGITAQPFAERSALPAAGTKDSKLTLLKNPGKPASETAAVTVTAPSSEIAAGTNFTIPIAVSDTTGRGIISYQFDVHYNPAVIQPQANAVEVAGTISSGLAAVFNPIVPGTIKVVVYGAYPLTGQGTLINMNFTAVGPAASVSPISWANFMFNEGNPGGSAQDGQIKIISETPGSSSTSFSGWETIAAKQDQHYNFFRGNSFVMVSGDQTNSTSLNVSFDLIPVDGQPGIYDTANGYWTMTFYQNGRYTGSIYGEVSRGWICDTPDVATGVTRERSIRARFRIMGGVDSYQSTVPEETGIHEFVSQTDYMNGKKTIGVLTDVH
jgi:hypothetical protein